MMELCSRCKKRVAVVFVTRFEGGKTLNEGICLKCAKELGIKPVESMIEKWDCPTKISTEWIWRWTI